MNTRNSQRLLAYALIAIGVIMLLSRIGGADWLWLALIATIFLVGYVSRQNYNFLVAGGVLMGIAVGTLIGTDSGMLLSLAAGFLAVDRIEPKPNRWALYSAGIFAVLGALVALGSFGLLSSVALALALVAAGAYLLYRGGDKADIPQATYTDRTPAARQAPTSAPSAPPAPEAAEPASGAPGDTASPAGHTPVRPSAPAAETPYSPDTPNEPYSGQTQSGTGSAQAPEPAAEPAPQAVLSAEAEARLRELTAWRRETARAEGVPAYIVFTNDTLTKIAAANPQTLDELGGVKGVGPIKKSRYGDPVLGVLRGDADETSEDNVSSDPKNAVS